MNITCKCGKRLRVPDEAAGKRVKCPECGERLLVEEAPAPAPARSPTARKPPAPAASTETTNNRPAKRRPPAQELEEEEDEPRPLKKGRKKKKAKKSVPLGLWLGVGGGAAALVVAVIVLVIAFNQPSKATTGPNAPPPAGQPVGAGQTPAAQEPRVELSDAQVSITSPITVGASVTYRFTQGKPAAGMYYACMLTTSYGHGMNGGTGFMLKADGAGMKTEGTVQNEFGQFHPIQAGEAVTYKIEMQQSPGENGPFRPIANALEGTAATTPAGPAAPPSSDPAHDKGVTADLTMIAATYDSFCDQHPLLTPSGPQDLYPLMGGEVDRLHAGLDGGQYLVLWHTRPFMFISPDGSSEFILAYEKGVPTGGGLAVMCDLKVRYLSAQEFQRASKAGRVGVDTLATVDPQTKKLHVKALIEEAKLVGVKLGDTVRIKGDCGVLRDKVVSLSVASVDHGTGPAVTAMELTKAFRDEPQGAAKKYDSQTIVVQGVVTDFNALHHELLLEGADE